MKKIVTTLALSAVMLMGGTSYESYTKEDRLADMHKLAQAMGDIQTGFFFNNLDMVQSGVNALTNTIGDIKPPLEEREEKDPMTRYTNNKVKLTNQIIKKINQKALTILERFKDGDPTQAVQAYNKITQQCMQCHSELRHW
jgi:cytochrome c556